MKKYVRKNYIDPRNKIGKYIKFNSRDKVICDFIDYVAFYGRWNPSLLMNLLVSDNWPSVYVWRITITKWDTPRLFTCFWQVVVAWKIVPIFRLQELKLSWSKDWNLKVDLYWKWVKLIREEWLWCDVLRVLKDYCKLDDITLTRADYTVDCAKYNFRKKNTLRNSTSWVICKANRVIHEKDYDITKNIESLNKTINDKQKKVQYILFGNKSSSTARFIRYYDKKREIVARWTQFLYPEYFDVPEVMRYELQVNSKWFDDDERHLKVEQIYDFITFWLNITDSSVSHKRVPRNESMYKRIEYWINKLKRENDYESLEKIKLLLFDPSEIWGIDSPVLCETFDLEKPFEHFSKCISKIEDLPML